MNIFTEIVNGREVDLEFDMEQVMSYGDPEDMDNTPYSLLLRKVDKLKTLAALCNADKIVFAEKIKGEEYKIIKGGGTFILTANPDPEGAWLNIGLRAPNTEVETKIQSNEEILEEVSLRR